MEQIISSISHILIIAAIIFMAYNQLIQAHQIIRINRRQDIISHRIKLSEKFVKASNQILSIEIQSKTLEDKNYTHKYLVAIEKIYYSQLVELEKQENETNATLSIYNILFK